MKHEVARLAGELAIVTLVLAVPASLLLPPSATAALAALGWVVGSITAAGLARSRSHSPQHSIGAIAAGFALKLGAVTAAWYLLRPGGIEPARSLGFLLALFLSHSIWTSCRFAVSSERQP